MRSEDLHDRGRQKWPVGPASWMVLRRALHGARSPESAQTSEVMRESPVRWDSAKCRLPLEAPELVAKTERVDPSDA